MDIILASAALKELGHPVRLNIFHLLMKSGHNGLPVGDLQTKLSIPNSTLSHHIAKLVLVGLVEQNRVGRTLYCIPQFDKLNQIIGFLEKECCIDEKCQTK